MNKPQMRKSLLKMRTEISSQRRKEASAELLRALSSKLPSGYILSFASLPDEIDLWDLNRQLVKENRLLLPKRKNGTLEVFLVQNLEDHLNLFYGSLLEPTHHCPIVPIEKVSCILVPGLGFDRQLFRIGYGQGYYDRLLQIAPCLKIGVAFKEQLIERLLPHESHDQRVDVLALF
jgi:5-formyltetrahydrofolate cyclo-ligase